MLPLRLFQASASATGNDDAETHASPRIPCSHHRQNTSVWRACQSMPWSDSIGSCCARVRRRCLSHGAPASDVSHVSPPELVPIITASCNVHQPCPVRTSFMLRSLSHTCNSKTITEAHDTLHLSVHTGSVLFAFSSGSLILTQGSCHIDATRRIFSRQAVVDRN